MRWIGLWALAAVCMAADGSLAAATDPPVQAPAAEVASGVWLIPGGFPPGREPDGNTVVLAGPGGLIVLDTGRHAWHRQAILDFAKGRGAPVAAIVNSHWHLDHTSGNAAIRRAYPDAHVYASRAVERALKGFLPRSADDDRQYLASGKVQGGLADDLRSDIAAIEDSAALIPDAPVAASRTMTLAGLRLRVNLARNAATGGDVWLYEPTERVAAVGDLVTLPAPFLDTACPAGWRAALDEIWATPFQIAVPGHGPPLSRTQFATWRTAFDALIDCAAGDRDKQQCAADWTAAVRPMLEPGDIGGRAQQLTADYVDLLRKNGGKSPYCDDTAAA